MAVTMELEEDRGGGNGEAVTLEVTLAAAMSASCCARVSSGFSPLYKGEW